ncbi:MAG TPA: alpha/beta hydrolase [Chryseolinea sp.]
MNPKTFSIITALLAFVVMMVILLPRITDASGYPYKGGHIEKSIELPTGVTLSYVEYGRTDGVHVIFLHGFTDSWHSFEYVLDKFPTNLHAIAISQRGHGNSTKTENTNDTKYFAADVAAFIREKNLGPCIIVGHSLGGLITQRFALDYPELTKAIVIVGSEPSFADNSGIPEFVSEIKKLKDPIDPKVAEAFQWSSVAKPIDSAVMKIYIGESLKVPAQVWSSVADLLMTTDFSLELRNIKVPALILWGDQDGVCKLKGQQQLVEGIANSRLVVYQGTGHSIHWEDGDRFVKDVASFIEMLQ